MAREPRQRWYAAVIFWVVIAMACLAASGVIIALADLAWFLLELAGVS